MSLSQQVSHPCPRCQTAGTMELHLSLVLDNGPVTRDVASNAFNRFRCPKCGADVPVECDVLVTNEARDLFFQVVVKDDQVAKAIADLRELAPPNSLIRVVASRHDLVEKVRLHLSKLDDVAFELAKFTMRLNQKDLAGKLNLRFDRVENDELVFIELSAQPPTRLRMPMKVYRTIAENFETAKYQMELEVDERLARKIMDANRPAKPAPPPSPNGFVSVPFAGEFGPCAGQRFSWVARNVVASAEAITGELTPQAGQLAPDQMRRPFLDGLEFRHEETSEGPFTHLRGPGLPTLRFFGELIEGARAGDLALLMVNAPGTGVLAVPLLLGQPLGSAFPVRGKWRIASQGDAIAFADPGRVLVLRAVEGKLYGSAIDTQSTQPFDVALSDTHLAVATGQLLLFFDRAALAKAPGVNPIAATLAPRLGTPKPKPEPAVVAAATTTKILADHPRLGRVTLDGLSGNPRPRPGTKVFLDDVREELPGIYRVKRYRVEGGFNWSEPQPGSLVLSATADTTAIPLPTRAPENQPPPALLATRLPALGVAAQATGAKLSPLLVRLMQDEFTDPLLRRGLRVLGLSMLEQLSPAELDGKPRRNHLVEDWSADPHLFELIPLGNGDSVALYLYPPWCAEGREPPVVTFRHEVNLLDFEALTFEAFLEKALRNPHLDGEHVRRVRERLQFPSVDRDVGVPPAFLPLDETWGRSAPVVLSTARELEAKGQLVEAERAAMAAYLREDPASKDVLVGILEKLGWTHLVSMLAPVDPSKPTPNTGPIVERFLASLSPTLRRSVLKKERTDLLGLMNPDGAGWRKLASECGVPCPPALVELGDAMGDVFVHVSTQEHDWDLLTPDGAREERRSLASLVAQFPELRARAKMLPLFGQDGDLLLLAADGTMWNFTHDDLADDRMVAPSLEALLQQFSR
ncbi:MAG: hypothetical protein JST54_01450 [Deltaproteobacteria bacterium]|nr:hypothetical protein [Deltaproteobacteria bacterium]